MTEESERFLTENACLEEILSCLDTSDPRMMFSSFNRLLEVDGIIFAVHYMFADKSFLRSFMNSSLDINNLCRLLEKLSKKDSDTEVLIYLNLQEMLLEYVTKDLLESVQIELFSSLCSLLVGSDLALRKNNVDGKSLFLEIFIRVCFFSSSIEVLSCAIHFLLNYVSCFNVQNCLNTTYWPLDKIGFEIDYLKASQVTSGTVVCNKTSCIDPILLERDSYVTRILSVFEQITFKHNGIFRRGEAAILEQPSQDQGEPPGVGFSGGYRHGSPVSKKDIEREVCNLGDCCTFEVTQANYEYQPWFKCLTCSPKSEKGCCLYCARTCHANHNVIFSRFSNFFCDCGAGDSDLVTTPQYCKKSTAQKRKFVPDDRGSFLYFDQGLVEVIVSDERLIPALKILVGKVENAMNSSDYSLLDAASPVEQARHQAFALYLSKHLRLENSDIYWKDKKPHFDIRLINYLTDEPSHFFFSRLVPFHTMNEKERKDIKISIDGKSSLTISKLLLNDDSANTVLPDLVNIRYNSEEKVLVGFQFFFCKQERNGLTGFLLPKSSRYIDIPPQAQTKKRYISFLLTPMEVLETMSSECFSIQGLCNVLPTSFFCQGIKLYFMNKQSFVFTSYMTPVFMLEDQVLCENVKSCVEYKHLLYCCNIVDCLARMAMSLFKSKTILKDKCLSNVLSNNYSDLKKLLSGRTRRLLSQLSTLRITHLDFDLSFMLKTSIVAIQSIEIPDCITPRLEDTLMCFSFLNGAEKFFGMKNYFLPCFFNSEISLEYLVKLNSILFDAPYCIQRMGVRIAIENLFVALHKGTISKPSCEEFLYTILEKQPANLQALFLMQIRNTVQDSAFWFCLLKDGNETGEVAPTSTNTSADAADFRCDSCSAYPIQGYRYHCMVCPDFDLCKNCFPPSEEDHFDKHAFAVHLIGDCKLQGNKLRYKREGAARVLSVFRKLPILFLSKWRNTPSLQNSAFDFTKPLLMARFFFVMKGSYTGISEFFSFLLVFMDESFMRIESPYSLETYDIFVRFVGRVFKVLNKILGGKTSKFIMTGEKKASTSKLLEVLTKLVIKCFSENTNAFFEKVVNMKLTKFHPNFYEFWTTNFYPEAEVGSESLYMGGLPPNLAFPSNFARVLMIALKHVLSFAESLGFVSELDPVLIESIHDQCIQVIVKKVSKAAVENARTSLQSIGLNDEEINSECSFYAFKKCFLCIVSSSDSYEVVDTLMALKLEASKKRTCFSKVCFNQSKKRTGTKRDTITNVNVLVQLFERFPFEEAIILNTIDVLFIAVHSCEISVLLNFFRSFDKADEFFRYLVEGTFSEAGRAIREGCSVFLLLLTRRQILESKLLLKLVIDKKFLKNPYFITSNLMQGLLLITTLIEETQELSEDFQRNMFGQIFWRLEHCVQHVAGNISFSEDGTKVGKVISQNPCQECWMMSDEIRSYKLDTIKKSAKFTAAVMTFELKELYQVRAIEMLVQPLLSKQFGVDNLFAQKSNRATIGLQKAVISALYSQSNIESTTSTNWRRVGEIDFSKSSIQTSKGNKRLQVSENKHRINVKSITHCNMLKVEFFFKKNNAHKSTEFLCPRCETKVTDAEHGICQSCGEVAFQCRICRNINYENTHAFLCVDCGHCKFAKFSISLEAARSFYHPNIKSQRSFESAKNNLKNLMKDCRSLRSSFEVVYLLSSSKIQQNLDEHVAINYERLDVLYNDMLVDKQNRESDKEKEVLKGGGTRFTAENFSALLSSFGDESLYTFLENRGSITEQLDRIRNYQRRRKNLFESKKRSFEVRQPIQTKVEKSFKELREVSTQIHHIKKKLSQFCSGFVSPILRCSTCEAIIAFYSIAALLCFLKSFKHFKVKLPLQQFLVHNGWLLMPLPMAQKVIKHDRDLNLKKQSKGVELLNILFMKDGIQQVVVEETLLVLERLLSSPTKMHDRNILGVLTAVKYLFTKDTCKAKNFQLKPFKLLFQRVLSSVFASKDSVIAISQESYCLIQSFCETIHSILSISTPNEVIHLPELQRYFFGLSVGLICRTPVFWEVDMQSVFSKWRTIGKPTLTDTVLSSHLSIFSSLQVFEGILSYVSKSTPSMKNMIYRAFMHDLLFQFCTVQDCGHNSRKLEVLALLIIMLYTRYTKTTADGTVVLLSQLQSVLRMFEISRSRLRVLWLAHGGQNEVSNGSGVHRDFKDSAEFSVHWLKYSFIIMYTIVPNILKQVNRTRLSKKILYHLCDLSYRVKAIDFLDDERIYTLVDQVYHVCFDVVSPSVNKISLLGDVILGLGHENIFPYRHMKILEKTLTELAASRSPNVQANDFKIYMQRSVAQEIYFRGSLSKNPVRQQDLQGGIKERKPRVSDLVKYITKELEITEAQDLMEILVCDKIVAQDLLLEDVYRHLWLKNIDDNNSESDFYDDELDEDDDFVEEDESEANGYDSWPYVFQSQNENEPTTTQKGQHGRDQSFSIFSEVLNNSYVKPMFQYFSNVVKLGLRIEKSSSPIESQSRPMIIVYRLRGIDGEATEDYIETISSEVEVEEKQSLILDAAVIDMILQLQRESLRILNDKNTLFVSLLYNVTSQFIKVLESIEWEELLRLTREKDLLDILFQIIDSLFCIPEEAVMILVVSQLMENILQDLSKSDFDLDCSDLSSRAYTMYLRLFESEKDDALKHIFKNRQILKTLAKVTLRLVSLQSDTWHRVSSHIVEVVNTAFLKSSQDSNYSRRQLEVLFFSLSIKNERISRLLYEEDITRTCLYKIKAMLSVILSSKKDGFSSVTLEKLHDIDLLLMFFSVAVHGNYEAEQLLVKTGVLKLIFRIEKLPNSRCSIPYRNIGDTESNQVSFFLNEICNSVLKSIKESNSELAYLIEKWNRVLKKKKLRKAKRRRKDAQLEISRSVKKQKTSSGANWLKELSSLDDLDNINCLICFEGRTFRPNKVMGVYVYTKPIGADDYFTVFSSLFGDSNSQSKEALPIFNSYCQGTSVSSFNVVHFCCHEQAVSMDRTKTVLKARKQEWEGAQIRNGHVLCNNLMPLAGSEGSGLDSAEYERAVIKYLNVLVKSILNLGDDLEVISVSTVRIGNKQVNGSGAFFLLFCFDIKSLLLRFAFQEDLTIDAKGGGKEDNFKLLVPLFQITCLMLGSESNTMLGSAEAIVKSVKEILVDSDRKAFGETAEAIPLLLVVFLFTGTADTWLDMKPKIIEKLEWFADMNARNAALQGYIHGSGAIKRKRGRSTSMVSNVDSVDELDAPNIEVEEPAKEESQNAAFRFYALLWKLFDFMKRYKGETNLERIRKWLAREEIAIEDCSRLVNFYNEKLVIANKKSDLLKLFGENV